MTLVSQADQMPIKVEEEVNPGPMLNSGYSSGSSTSSTNAAGRKKKKSLSTDKKYLSIQCTGYLKSWPLTKVGLEPESSHGAEEGDPESCMSCLVAVGKIQPSFQVRFSFRLSTYFLFFIFFQNPVSFQPSLERNKKYIVIYCYRQLLKTA